MRTLAIKPCGQTQLIWSYIHAYTCIHTYTHIHLNPGPYMHVFSHVPTTVITTPSPVLPSLPPSSRRFSMSTASRITTTPITATQPPPLQVRTLRAQNIEVMVSPYVQSIAEQSVNYPEAKAAGALALNGSLSDVYRAPVMYAYRQTDAQIHRRTGRHTDIQTYIHTYAHRPSWVLTSRALPSMTCLRKKVDARWGKISFGTTLGSME